jgi:hypothetical protein
VAVMGESASPQHLATLSSRITQVLWGVKFVGGLYILARCLGERDTIIPRYVLDEGGKVTHYVHQAPRDTMRLVALLRACREITISGLHKVAFGRAEATVVEEATHVLGGVEVTLLRTPPEEGVVDAQALLDTAKRRGTQYEWAFLLRNAAGGLEVEEETGGRQYLVPEAAELAELVKTQAMNRLLVQSVGRNWQIRCDGGLLGVGVGSEWWNLHWCVLQGGCLQAPLSLSPGGSWLRCIEITDAGFVVSAAGDGELVEKTVKVAGGGSGGLGRAGGWLSFGWDVGLKYVPGLVRKSCGLQGLHEDLEAEQAEDPSGFLVHWPISAERELSWWRGGHKIVRRVGELQNSRTLRGEHEFVETELMYQLVKGGVEGVPEVGENRRVPMSITPIRLGFIGVMHACMPHCGRGVPASEPYQANFGVHGYVMLEGCRKGNNVTWACPPAVA